MRKRRSFAFPCGCTTDGARWLSLCEQHEREERELHERARIEHEARQREQQQQERATSE